MDGILIINKDKEWTSHDVVAKVRKITGEKVGHTGTLDPLATGVLPLLIGKGTKFSKYLINHDKIYEVELKLGKKTDSADSEGKILEEKLVNKEYIKENIENVLESFIGKQEQIPPMYSAIKKNGKKLYEYAREGKKVEVEPRKIEIYEIELINYKDNIIKFKVSCSKGTYIRSLCENIAEKLKTVGYMKNLNRLRVGNFKLEDAIKIEDLNETNIEKHLISFEEILKENDLIGLNTKKLKLFLNGVSLTIQKKDGLYKIYYEDRFIGTGTVKNNLLKRDIIL